LEAKKGVEKTTKDRVKKKRKTSSSNKRKSRGGKRIPVLEKQRDAGRSTKKKKTHSSDKTRKCKSSNIRGEKGEYKRGEKNGGQPQKGKLPLRKKRPK